MSFLLAKAESPRSAASKGGRAREEAPLNARAIPANACIPMEVGPG